MEVGKILPVEAAAILHASPQFVRVAMQQEKLPIGTAIKMSSIWTFWQWRSSAEMLLMAGLFWQVAFVFVVGTEYQKR